MFVHSCLDDYGLTASEFRVYGHLVRRASKTDKAWPKVKNMAHVCRLHPNTVRRSLKRLVFLRMIDPATTSEPRLVRRAEAARRLSRSLRFVDKLAASGVLPKRRLPNRKRAAGFLESDLNALISSQPVSDNDKREIL